MTLNYISTFSGIEAATTAWHPLGWKPLWFSEIEKFPSAVLAARYPETPNLGDINEFHTWPDAKPDLLVGGSPCQAFSVAGLRKGLADPRGQLMLTYLGVLDRYRPRWVLWENVPGVLSSHGGRDFGTFLGALAELGYGFAYRVLDAQYVRTQSHPRAVPQRRRRVFVVGYLGDWRRAAAVLFERQSLLRDTPPRRQTRQEVTHDVAGCAGGSGRGFARTGERGTPLVPERTNALTRRISKGVNSDCDDGMTLIPSLGLNARQDPDSWEERSGPLDSNGTTQAVAFTVSVPANGFAWEKDFSPTLDSTCGKMPNQQYGVRDGYQVRRLTVEECERLQGFPTGHTRVAWRNKAPEDCPDGPRYKAIGNSMAVNVMHWVGQRIQLVELLYPQEKEN